MGQLYKGDCLVMESGGGYTGGCGIDVTGSTITNCGVTKVNGYTGDVCVGDIQYSSFEMTSVSSGATVSIDSFTTQFTPNQDFTISAGVVKEGMQYVVRINSGATAYTMTLGTGIANPFSEDLTLTASKMTTIIMLATSSSSLEIFGVRTED